MSDKNTEEKVMKTWGESQQKLMTDWLDTLRRLGGTPTLELWRKTVDTWQTSVKETLDAQMEWTRQWTETLAKAKGTPEELRELARRGPDSILAGHRKQDDQYAGRFGSSLDWRWHWDEAARKDERPVDE